MGQWTPDHMVSYLTGSYRLVMVALIAAILVELWCFRRVRRFNAWLDLLAGATVCLQTIVVVIQLTARWDDVSMYVVVLKVAMLGFSGVALVGLWLVMRRIWSERTQSRGPMALVRVGSAVLLTFAFSYQLHWGKWLLDLFGQARSG